MSICLAINYVGIVDIEAISLLDEIENGPIRRIVDFGRLLRIDCLHDFLVTLVVFGVLMGKLAENAARCGLLIRLKHLAFYTSSRFFWYRKRRTSE
jgi:hypothetical protein